jgi:hypothetical protein
MQAWWIPSTTPDSPSPSVRLQVEREKKLQLAIDTIKDTTPNVAQRLLAIHNDEIKLSSHDHPQVVTTAPAADSAIINRSSGMLTIKGKLSVLPTTIMGMIYSMLSLNDHFTFSYVDRALLVFGTRPECQPTNGHYAITYDQSIGSRLLWASRLARHRPHSLILPNSIDIVPAGSLSTNNEAFTMMKQAIIGLASTLRELEVVTTLTSRHGQGYLSWQHLTQLTKLVTRSQFDDQHLKPFSQLTNLRHLDVPHLDKDDYDVLPSSLTSITTKGWNMSDYSDNNGCDYFMRTLPRLRHLAHINVPPRVHMRLLEIIAKLPSLTSIHRLLDHYNSSELKEAPSMSYLKCLNIRVGDRGTLPMLAKLAPSLHTLVITYEFGGNYHWEHEIGMLPSLLPSLTNVSLEINDDRHNPLSSLQLLSHCLTKLRLTFCPDTITYHNISSLTCLSSLDLVIGDSDQLISFTSIPMRYQWPDLKAINLSCDTAVIGMRFINTFPITILSPSSLQPLPLPLPSTPLSSTTTTESKGGEGSLHVRFESQRVMTWIKAGLKPCTASVATNRDLSAKALTNIGIHVTRHDPLPTSK